MSSANPRELRFVSWNVNGLRATLKKDPSFQQIFDQFGADVFAIQETKLQDEQRVKLHEIEFEGYHQVWNMQGNAADFNIDGFDTINFDFYG